MCRHGLRQSRVVRQVHGMLHGQRLDQAYVHRGRSRKFDKVRDRKGLEAKMASGGWTRKTRRDRHVDRIIAPDNQGSVHPPIARSRYHDAPLDAEEP